MAKIDWQPITDDRLHGVTATVGNRRVEVVRTDNCCSLWTYFSYLDGKMVRQAPGPGICRMDGWTFFSDDMSKADAMKGARAFLAQGTKRRVTTQPM